MSNIDVRRTIRDKIGNINALPTIPTVLKKLLAVIENLKVSLSEISNFISSDPALTTRVLKMVNSPIYGFPGRISSVNQAVILLGLAVVRGLLLGVPVFELMQKTVIGLWERSFGTAIFSRLIAIEKGLKEPDELSVEGLLHDIGKVLLLLRYPEKYEKAMNEAENNLLVIYETEKNYFNTTHANVGAWMAQKWRFPRNLIDVIDYHHKPHLAKTAPVDSAIIHLADILVRARRFGFARVRFLMPVNPEAGDRLALSEAQIKEILLEAEDSFQMTGDLFL